MDVFLGWLLGIATAMVVVVVLLALMADPEDMDEYPR